MFNTAVLAHAIYPGAPAGATVTMYPLVDCPAPHFRVFASLVGLAQPLIGIALVNLCLLVLVSD